MFCKANLATIKHINPLIEAESMSSNQYVTARPDVVAGDRHRRPSF
jgi:hypothetical protein